MGRLTEYFGYCTGELPEENGRFLTLTDEQRRRARREYRKGLKDKEAALMPLFGATMGDCPFLP